MIHSEESCVGCYRFDRGHDDMHLFVARLGWCLGSRMDDGRCLYIDRAPLLVCFFDARLLEQSTVGAVMARETAASRYAKWLRLLRRRIECKGVRVGRIHKLWTVYCSWCAWVGGGRPRRTLSGVRWWFGGWW
jgi:hypothetical protein